MIEQKIYRASIQDDWGGETIKYFKTSEEEMRIWLHEFFNQNSQEVEFDETYKEEQASLDLENLTARYFQNIGFVLGHNIVISEATDLDPSKCIYRVAHQYQHIDSEIGLFQELQLAKDFLLQHIEQKKSSYDLMKEEDLIDEDIQSKQGELIELKDKGNNKYVASLFFMSKTSYEYDEWDVDSYACFIKEIPIEIIEKDVA